MKQINCRDEQLVILISQGNSVAYKQLREKYYSIFLKYLKDYVLENKLSIQVDEIINSFDDVFNIVLDDYEIGKGPFYPFFNVIIFRSIFKDLKRIENISFSKPVSLDTQITFSDEPLTLNDIVADIDSNFVSETFSSTKLENLIRDENYRGTGRFTSNKCRLVLKMKLAGFTYREVGEKFGLSISSVKRIVHDAIRKMGVEAKRDMLAF